MKTDFRIDKGKKINIAFGIMGGDSWTFGSVYLKDLIKSLKQYGPKHFNYYLFIPNSQKTKIPEVGNDDNVIYYEDPENERTDNFIINMYNAVTRRLFKNKINSYLKKQEIDIFFSLYINYPLSNVKTLSWIPDFQHIHFPDMFSNNECKKLDKLFIDTAKYSSRVILFSEAAKKDFKAFAPEYLYKVRVYPPISLIDPSIYETPLSDIIKRYDLPDKFIFLPNQFWKHKNHATVFKAIKVLKERGIKILLVCAGNASDYRHPAYFSILTRKISECKIRNQIIYIGIIPRMDVLLLLRQSVCLINPSLFEGFGFTVDEARSIGKKMILSDIPSHKEQDPPGAIYFNPYDIEELANIIESVWLGTTSGPGYNLELDARNDAVERMQKNILIFTGIVEETLELKDL